MLKHISEELHKKRVLAGRKGGTNKRGKKNNTTLTKELALKLYNEGVIKRTQGLLHIQSVLAAGTIKVFRIDSYWEERGKTKYKVKNKPALVHDDDEIIAALDYEFGDGESPSDDLHYYFVATQDPNPMVIEHMMSRTFGRPKESIEITNPPELDKKKRELANEAIRKYLDGKRTKNPAK